LLRPSYFTLASSLPGRRDSGVTRQSIIVSNKVRLAMDARVKPAHDEIGGQYSV
jgi:hypothetical protein